MQSELNDLMGITPRGTNPTAQTPEKVTKTTTTQTPEELEKLKKALEEKQSLEEQAFWAEIELKEKLAAAGD
ncbi:hypothetical protein KJ780_02385, partial [Candidatus Micrarchaeota archaeon]|nr:hypothetical protein [Candidatus Micrarchaeota archaeon]